MTFHEKTLFVLGAGSGVDYRMPLGSKLAQSIQDGTSFRFDFGNVIHGDKELFATMRNAFHPDVNAAISAAQRISRGILTADSIDTFIDRYAEDAAVADVGKFLIAYYILKAERESKLKVNFERADGGDISPSGWMARFSTMLFSGLRRADLANLRDFVSVITFNYDRTLERYLQAALRQGFELDWTTAHETVSTMEIVHPYGTLGPLPPNPTQSGGPYVAFGADGYGLDWRSIPSRLSTFTEQIADGDMLARIKVLVENASRIVFLGFAFHSPNMRLLKAETKGINAIYSTGVGLSEQERSALAERCLKMLSRPIHRQTLAKVHIELDRDASALLNIHRLNLLAS